MRAFQWDGLLSGAVDSVFLHYLPVFAFALGASNAEIGMLAAAVGLSAAASCLPGAWLSTRFRYRKPFVLFTRGGLAHGFLLVFALLSLAGDRSSLLPILVAAAAGRAFAVNLSEGAWASLAADLVPSGIRGRYFASRNRYLGIGGLAGAGIVGLLLSALGPGEEWAAVWGVLVAIGAAASWTYSRIPEADIPVEPREPQADGRVAITMLRDANFMAYVGTVLLWSVSIQVAAPFFNVHLVKNLGASPAWVAVLLIIPAATGLLGQTILGRLVDSRGARWTMALAGLTIPCLPLAWWFVNAPYQVIAINAVGGAVWAGYTLASFNFLLAISPGERRRSYVATYQTIVFFAMFVGPLLGGALANAYGIKLLFLLSAGGRALATSLYITFVREMRAEASADSRAVAAAAATTPI